MFKNIFCLIRNLIKISLLKRKIKQDGGYIGKNVKLRFYGSYDFGKNVIVNDKGIDSIARSQIIICKEGKLTIGNNSGISSSSVYCSDKIFIGNNVKIGAGCLIIDTDFHSLDWKIRAEGGADFKNAKKSPISIEDDVFIGSRTIICKGITIGKRSIIAAGSVVVKDVPNDEIWGGNPAKFIRFI